MITKNLPKLPKLPRGEGSYDYIANGIIRYRKQINGKTVTAYGETISQVNKEMYAKEEGKEEQKDKVIRHQKKSPTLDNDMEQWIQTYKKPELKERSYDRIESTFYVHIHQSEIGWMRVDDIDPKSIISFMGRLYNHTSDGELSFSSKVKVYDLLSQYFYHKHLINHTQNYNPMLLVPRPNKCETEDMIVYSDEEMMIITNYCLDLRNTSNKYDCFLCFIMWTFMRSGEALALKWKDIDIENGIVYVHDAIGLIKNRDGKNSSKRYIKKLTGTKYQSKRYIKMCDMSIQCIKRHKEKMNPKSNEEYCTVNSTDIKDTLSANSTNRLLHILQENAGLTDKKITIHGLRHCGISYMIRNGMPIEVVSKLAGHKSIQITMDTYYSILEEQKIKSIEMIDSISRQKNKE